MISLNELEKVLLETRSRTFEILKFTKDEEERGLELHRKYIVIDSMHTGEGVMPYSERMVQRAEEMVAAGIPPGDIYAQMAKMRAVETVEDPKTREEYDKVWKKSGVTCGNRTLWIGSSGSFMEAIRYISHARRRIDGLRDMEQLATCADDIKRAKKEEKRAILWNFQNTTVLNFISSFVDMDDELNNIDLFYGLGVRVMQLTYNLRNLVGDGCTSRYESGLSYFGVNVVERMNQLGMLVDTGHCGYQTTLDAVEVSKFPIAATHTTCKGVYDHRRGKTDEELKAIAENGGYVGINVLPVFLGGNGTIKEFLDHIDYAVNLIGADHVGIGTDTMYSSNVPQSLIDLRKRRRHGHAFGVGSWSGFRDGDPKASLEINPKMKRDESSRGSLAWINWPYFTVGLVSRGYSDQEVKNIIGGNFLNLLEKVIG